MTLLGTLERELTLVKRFVEILAQEQAVLVQGKVHDMAELTDAKTPLLDELVALAANRDNLLHLAGYPSSNEGLKTWVTVQADPAVDTLYESLKQFSNEARRLNLLNASLVNTRLQVTQQALSILLPAENTPSLYDTQGQSSQRVGYKLIDSA